MRHSRSKNIFIFFWFFKSFSTDCLNIDDILCVEFKTGFPFLGECVRVSLKRNVMTTSTEKSTLIAIYGIHIFSALFSMKLISSFEMIKRWVQSNCQNWNSASKPKSIRQMKSDNEQIQACVRAHTHTHSQTIKLILILFKVIKKYIYIWRETRFSDFHLRLKKVYFIIRLNFSSVRSLFNRRKAKIYRSSTMRNVFGAVVVCLAE